MRLFTRTLISLLFVLPAPVLAYMAVPRIGNGFALDEAIPVPYQLLMGYDTPRPAYLDAENALANAAPANGDARIMHAEIARHLGAPPEAQISELVTGLQSSPASARGWTDLAEVWGQSDKPRAASALAQALILAPSDYWTIGAKTRDAAWLWPFLDADSQARALQQTRLLLENPRLATQLSSLLSSQAGMALFIRAFKDNPDQYPEQPDNGL